MAFGGITFRMPPNAIFFNSRQVMDATSKAERRVLFRFGMETRKDARKSMRRKQRGPSDPGRPPRVVTGLLKRFLFFGYEKESHSVVIGPAQLSGFPGAGEAPQALEYGTSDIAARPFMGPAFRRQLDENMPQMWRDAIR